MKPLKIEFELPERVLPEIRWAWELFCTHWGLSYKSVDEGGDLSIGTGSSDHIRVSEQFDRMMQEERFDQREVFGEEALFRCEDGTTDILGTAFYMVNSLQEWGAKEGDHDQHGRFLFSASYQYRFGVVERDLVSEHFEELYRHLEEKLGPLQGKRPSTRFYLTHDIDRIERGNIREASWKLKKGRFIGALKSLWDRSRGRHEWENIEAIMELHERYGAKSNFFWLTEKGRAPDGIRNADYDLRLPRFQRTMERVKARGFSNGLHKSSFERGFEEEFQKLAHAERINRNHYLKFQLPQHYQALEEDGFLLDTSLGFREAIGFRNSYGRPFHPFDPHRRSKMRLLEVPLHIMDVTLTSRYRNPLKKAMEFIQSCPSGTLTTILWHNNYLTEGRFKEWKRIYKGILERGAKEGIEMSDPERLTEKPPPSPMGKEG